MRTNGESESPPAGQTALPKGAQGCAVGLVITEPSTKVFAQPYFAELIRGVSGALARKSATMVLLMPSSPHTFEQDAAFLCGGHLCGAVLVSLHEGNPLMDRLMESGLPIVIQGRPIKGCEVGSVDIDNKEAGAMAVGHLISTGRKTIGTIAGNLSMPGAVERLEGYREALSRAAIRLDPTLEEVGDYQAEVAHLAAERLLMNHPDIDAVFAASDLMARAAIAVLQKAGRRVPEDVAVIGVDDSAVARACRPPLSSIRQPTEELGKKSVELLMGVIADPSGPPSRVILPSQLIVRASTTGSGEI